MGHSLARPRLFIEEQEAQAKQLGLSDVQFAEREIPFRFLSHRITSEQEEEIARLFMETTAGEAATSTPKLAGKKALAAV